MELPSDLMDRHPDHPEAVAPTGVFLPNSKPNLLKFDVEMVEESFILAPISWNLVEKQVRNKGLKIFRFSDDDDGTGGVSEKKTEYSGCHTALGTCPRVVGTSGHALAGVWRRMGDYHPGRANVVANELSRKSQGRINALYASRIPLLADLRPTRVRLEVEDHKVALLANFQVRPILIDRVLEAQMVDEETQEIIQVRNQGKRKDLRVRESDSMLMQESRMFVPNNLELKKAILDEAYISAYAMHPEATKMYHTIRPFYYWPGMKRATAEYMSRCAVCQQVKAERKKSFGLLQPFPVPEWKWENITMDFVYKLPCTHNGFDGIWVIVDRLTKSTHFIQVREKYSLGRLAELFISKIVKYHGVPLSPWRGVIRFGKKGKLRPKYIGPYMITERVCEVAYRLELPSELAKVHNVFHVSMLRHYVVDPSHVIHPQPLEINPDLTYDDEPVMILDWKEKVVRNRTVSLVKVLWRNHSAEKATWETEDRMRDLYPRLFFDH
ncbi:uncharacterized protein [Pyrus communis]|uniref:uncharacterized protein n=1 Tax=Pyrus communis TaxID=23211 RepID=UPI0035C19E0E